MNEAFKLPPKSVKLLTKPDELTQNFSELIGKEFKITGKTRTDGSNIRKLIAET
jgi:hypothetical protein